MKRLALCNKMVARAVPIWDGSGRIQSLAGANKAWALSNKIFSHSDVLA